MNTQETIGEKMKRLRENAEKEMDKIWARHDKLDCINQNSHQTTECQPDPLYCKDNFKNIYTHCLNCGKEMGLDENRICTKKHPEHICRFNDGESTCECYEAGYNLALQKQREEIVEMIEEMKKPGLTKPARPGVIGTMVINTEYNNAIYDIIKAIKDIDK